MTPKCSKAQDSSNFVKKGKILYGKKIVFSKEREFSEYIAGYGIFPLLPWLLTPYKGKGIPEFKSKFNKQYLAKKKVVERALARLKDR